MLSRIRSCCLQKTKRNKNRRCSLAFVPVVCNLRRPSNGAVTNHVQGAVPLEPPFFSDAGGHPIYPKASDFNGVLLEAAPLRVASKFHSFSLRNQTYHPINHMFQHPNLRVHRRQQWARLYLDPRYYYLLYKGNNHLPVP